MTIRRKTNTKKIIIALCAFVFAITTSVAPVMAAQAPDSGWKCTKPDPQPDLPNNGTTNEEEDQSAKDPGEQSQSDCFSENEIIYFDPTGGTCGTGVTGQGISKLDGYSLPATKGRTGNEEPINANGQIPSGGRVTFANHAAKGQEYRDYYITMRWRYVKWNWNGTSSGSDNKQFNWMKDKPRLVLVTNPRTQKSIIAVALEAGPAPWTGVDTAPNNNPKQGWKNPQDGTPDAYTGRVSGFPPKAIKELGAKQGMAKSAGGEGDELLYSWAPDQNAKPGPVKIIQGEAPSGSVSPSDYGGCASAGSFVNAEGYAMPIALAKKDIGNGYRWPCPKICHHDGTAAFDLAHIRAQGSNSSRDPLTAGTPVVAINSGKATSQRTTYMGIAGCGSFQFVQDKNKDVGGEGSWYYWYGHLSNKYDVKEGQHVPAGTKLGVVGPRKCTGNGSYPHLHIDRGKPKGSPGGSPSTSRRHESFVDLLNSIYASMPN